MQKCGKILRGRKDTLAPVVSTLRGGRRRRPRRSDASVTDRNVFHGLARHHATPDRPGAVASCSCCGGVLCYERPRTAERYSSTWMHRVHRSTHDAATLRCRFSRLPSHHHSLMTTGCHSVPRGISSNTRNETSNLVKTIVNSLWKHSNLKQYTSRPHYVIALRHRDVNKISMQIR